MAYRTQRQVFDQERTVLVTYNENLLLGQLQGIQANLEKSRAKLRRIQQVLRRRQAGKVKGGKAPTADSVRQQVEKALSAQYMKGLIEYEVGHSPALNLSFRTNTQALAHLVQTQLGKTILFTDNESWTNEEIVLGYRSQSQIENAFRDMKNPHFLGWSPMFHWTDSKIRVHAFYCVLALMLSSLLQRTLHQQGIDLSLPRMREVLGGIKEAAVLYPPKTGERQPQIAYCLSTLDGEQQRLFDKLNLTRYQVV